MAATKLARLKPYDPRRRHLLRSYMHGPSGQRFDEKRGWYKVNESVAKYLAKVHQIESDPESPLAFDVCTVEEAQAIDKREKVVAERRASAGDPNDLTTKDLGENRRRAADVTEEARPRVPRAQRGIRRGVRDPRERSMRPVEDETA